MNSVGRMEWQEGGQQAPDFFVLNKVVVKCLEGRVLAFSVTATAFTALLFAAVFVLACPYQSEGYLQANRPLSEFNAQRPALEDRANLLRYLQTQKQVDNPNAAYLLRTIGPHMMQKRVRAVLTFSKEDLRYLSDSKAPLAANVLGIGISFPAGAAEDAAERVKLMGEYMRDSMLRLDLLTHIRASVAEAKSQKQTLDNRLIVKRLELDVATRKLKALRTIAARYPEASRSEVRQLLSSDSNTSRYLPPVIQLVGVESVIADLRIAEAALEREIAQNALRLDFYSRADAMEASAPTGKTMLAAFKALKTETFKATDVDNDWVREVVNSIRLVADTLESKHVAATHFTSGPTVPENRSGPSVIALLLVALVFGSLLAGMAVLAFERVFGSGTKSDALLGTPVQH